MDSFGDAGPTDEVYKSWGANTESMLPLNFKSRICEPETLDDMRRRQHRRPIEFVVSRRGKRGWTVGPLDLPHDSVTDVLLGDGYECVEDRIFEEVPLRYRVEKFRGPEELFPGLYRPTDLYRSSRYVPVTVRS